MTDDGTDKTSEVREQLGEDGAVGGQTDDDTGSVLTLDSDSDSGDSEGESPRGRSGNDGGR